MSTLSRGPWSIQITQRTVEHSKIEIEEINIMGRREKYTQEVVAILPGQRTPTIDAQAQLIASAPNMLRTLKHIKKSLTMGDINATLLRRLTMQINESEL